jgi:UDP-N-acetylglucosamine 2-epimerase
LREGVAPEKIFVTGNTVIDALLATVRPDYVFKGDLARILRMDGRGQGGSYGGGHGGSNGRIVGQGESYDGGGGQGEGKDNGEQGEGAVSGGTAAGSAGLMPKGRLLLVTTHRRENLGEPLREVYLALRDLLEVFADIQIVFPMHKNPVVREVVEKVLGGLDRVHLVEPMDYQPFTNLMNHAALVLTDSGGMQEEAPALGKPVLVLRDTTERPEAVEAGTVKLVGANRETVFQTARELLADEAAYARMAQAANPYGDGQAARRTVLAIRRYFGLTDEPWVGFGE